MSKGRLGTAGRTGHRNELKPAAPQTDRQVLAAAQRDLRRALIQRWRTGQPPIVGSRTTSFAAQRRQKAPT